jgi:hypothetical protein
VTSDGETPRLVFSATSEKVLRSAEERLAKLLPTARRDAASPLARIASIFRTDRALIPGPARNKIVTLSRRSPLGQAFVSVDEHADGSDMLDVTRMHPRRGRHVHELILKDHDVHLEVETHGRLDGVTSTRNGSPSDILRLLSLVHGVVETALMRRIEAVDPFRHAVAARLASSGNPEPMVRMSTIGGGAPLLVPAVDVMWPTPVTSARYGILDRDIDVWALNDPIDSGLPTTWELDAREFSGHLKVELRPMVTRLPRPANPVEVLRGEAAFAAAA